MFHKEPWYDGGMELGELTVRLSRVEEAAYKARISAIDIAMNEAHKPALALAQGAGNLNGALAGAGAHDAARAAAVERSKAVLRTSLLVMREEVKQLEAVK